jgi:hypothetical protein
VIQTLTRFHTEVEPAQVFKIEFVVVDGFVILQEAVRIMYGDVPHLDKLRHEEKTCYLFWCLDSIVTGEQVSLASRTHQSTEKCKSWTGINKVTAQMTRIWISMTRIFDMYTTNRAFL